MPSKIRIVLEGYARYRDGKKWKKRYCVLSLSPTNLDALHLYITKSYDDFAAYRNSGSVLTAMLPIVRKPHELPISPESRSLLGESAVVQRPSDQTYMSSSTLLQQNTSTNYSLTSSSGPLVNTAAYSCVAALESTSSGLATASNLASSVGGPAPVDEITGFESGYHMDKESNIIVLIGGSSVYALALSGMDEMFRWADNLARIVVDNRFRVTLRHTGDGSKLFQGLQGSLHVQHWRLCLIGEPSSGCKFICNWRLDHVEKAYTMTMPAQNANQFFTSNNTTSNSSSSSISNNNSSSSGTSGISSSSNYTTTNNTTIGMNNSISMSSSVTISSSSSSNTSHSQALDIHHHRTSGSFGSASRNPTNVSPATNSNSTPSNTNKYLFFMECSPASGKGRGSYVFEIDGSRLVELTIAIEQFTALRYNSNLKPATSAEAAQLTVAAQSALGTSSFNAVDCCNNIFRSNPVCALQPNGCIVHDDAANNNNNIASSFSSDTSSNPRSISPTHHHHHQQQQHRNQQQQQQQQQLRKRRSRDSIFNPLRKISSGHHNFNLFNKTSDYQASTIDRIPPNKQVIAPQLNSQSSVPVMHSSSKCSWSLQRTSSLSPPDMLTNNDLVGDAYNSNSLSRPTSTTTTTNENTFKGASSCSISAVQAAISAINNIQEGNNSPIDLASLLTKSLQNHDVSIPNHQDQSIAINNHHPVTSSSICSHSPLFIGSSAVHGGVVQHHHHHHHHHQHSHLPPSYRLNDDTPTLCSSASLTVTSTTTSGYDLIDNMSDTNYFLHDNVQVAKVAAGLIISKKPPYYYNNNTSTANNNVVCAYPTRTTCCLTSICATSFCSSITGHRQAPLLPPPASSRPPLHHHHHHPHHHQQQRLIFENNQSSSSSSTGCNTTAVLPSVPIPSIGTDISTHSGIQHSSSLHSNECNINSSGRLQFRQPSREQQQNHHQISSSNPNSTSQLSDSLYTSSSDYSNYGGLVNSLTESTLDQVDSQRDSGVTSQPTTTAAAVAPSSSNNSTVNPEVFTTDEDYWDLRTTSSSGSNQWKSQLYSSKTSLTGVDGDCAVAKKLNYYSSVITDLPATTTLGSSHTCKELLSNDTCERQYKLVMNVNTTHNPYSFYYSSSIEPGQCIYRRRLQQYRVCVCKSLLRRSFSANTNLQLIDISNKLQNDEYRTDRILRTMRSLDSCCVATTTTAATSTTTSTTATTTTNDEHNLIQNICDQYSRCCRTTKSSNSNSNISIRPPAPSLSSSKLLCGGAAAGAGRFQRIHRLFQRKHSQSHDSLQSRKNSMDDRPVIFNDSEYCITTGGDGDKSSFDKPLHSDMLPWDGIDELKQEQQQQQQEKHFNTSHTDNNNDKSVELSCRVLNCPRHGIRRLHWRNIDPQQILLLTNRKAESLSQLKKLMKSRATTATATSNDFVVHHEKHSTPTILPSNSPNTVVVNNCTTAAAAAATAAHYSPVVSGRWRNRRTHHHHYFTRKIDSKAKGLYLHENNSDSDLITAQAIRTNNCPQSSISSSEMKTHSLSPLRKHSSTSSAINQSNGGHYYYHYYYYHHHNAVSSPSERSQSLISVNSLPCSEPSLSKIDNHNSNIIMHSLLHMNYTDSMEQLLLLQLPPPSSSSSSIHRYDSSVLLLKPTTTTTTNTSTTTNQQVVNSSELINTTDDDNGGGESDKVCSKSSCTNCTMMQKTDSTDRQFDIPKFNRSVSSSSSSSVKPFALPSSTTAADSSSWSNTTLRASTLPTTRILNGDDGQSINKNSLLQLTTPYNHQQQHAYVNSRMNVVDNPESTHYHHQKSNRLQSSVSNLDRLLPALLLQRTSTRQSAIPSSVHDNGGAVVVTSGSDNSMPRKFSYQSSEVDSSPRIVINSNANTVSKKGKRRKSNEEVSDKTTALQVDEQLSSDIHTYNNLIRLQEYPNDDSTALHGLKSIPTSLSSSGYDPTTSQFLHLTIHEENDTSCQSQPSSSSPCSSASSSSTTSYVNFPGFWSNIHSTTSSSGIAVAASASASPSIVATTSSMENRLYANLIPKTNQKYTKHSYNNNNNNNSKGTLLSQLPMNNAHCDTITTSNCAGQSSLYTTGDNILHSTDSHYLPQTTTTTINLLSKSNSSGPPPTTTIISLGGGGNLMPSSTSQCCCSPMGGVHLHPAQAPPPPLPSVVNMPTETDYSCLPAEVRDPSRNYAMVDLRPSPASSTLPPTELTLSLNHQHHNTNEQHTSQSSSSSIDDSVCSNSGVSLTHNSNSSNNNNSTSTTGSDCTSDAATLTSDTIENYSTVCCNPPHESSSLSYSNNTNNNSKAMNTSKVKSKNSSMDTDSCDHFLLNTMKSRRRHSHSLSSSLSSTAMMTTTTDPPILNYVHVIAASNTRFTSTETARSSDPGSVSDRHHIGGGGGIITELGNSPSSSSGLGGVTSQSNASSLAAPASSTSFGDIFSCRSMTSSGTSSVEGNNNIHINSNNPEMMMMMPTELSSCSPPDDNCVIYTQIDFTRTMALGELSNDIMAQENQIANNTNINNNNSNNRLSSSMIASRGNTTTTANTSSTGTTSSSSSRNKIDRTTSVKKTLYRSIRLIGGRGSRKKVG